MRPRDQIDAYSLAVLGIILVVSSAIFFAPTEPAHLAGRDAWLTFVAIGLASALYMAPLVHFYFGPRLTPLDRAAAIPGLRPLAALLFAGYAGYVYAVVLRETTSILTLITPEMSIDIYTAGLVLVSLLLALYGLETIARCASILFPVLLLAAVVNLLFALPGSADVKQLYPILERGVGPVLAGMPSAAGFAAELLLLTFLSRSVARYSQPGRALFFAIGVITVLLAGSTLVAILVLGPEETVRSTFPVVVLARQVRIASFLSRIEIAIILAWGFGVFIKTGVLVYLAGLLLQQGFNLHEDWRPRITAAAAVLIGYLSIYAIPNVITLLQIFAETGARIAIAAAILTLLLGLLPAQPRRGSATAGGPAGGGRAANGRATRRPAAGAPRRVAGGHRP